MTTQHLAAPEFWIDVGGTFTDCFVRRSDGTTDRHKLLSTAVTKGSCEQGTSATTIVDRARRGDPPRFWDGYRLRVVAADGTTSAETFVARFETAPGAACDDHSSAATGALHLDPPLPFGPAVGQRYEILSDEEAPTLAIRYLLKLGRHDAIPPLSVRLGTTRGTNALLTRRGARTALVTTQGFADILHIGYQNRPRLFDLAIVKPAPLFEQSIAVEERLAADGKVLVPPRRDEIARQLAGLRAAGIESLAICLLHGFEYTAHEELVANVAREVGFDEISVSHRVAPLIKIVARGDTTVIDAYLNPVLRRYVNRLLEALGESSRLRIMTSAGGLVEGGQFVGKDSILSGPAGGVVGFSRVALAAGFERSIGFDMGGTSTDVSRFDGRHELEFENEKAGVRVVAPMLRIHTVAAGGGSICAFDGVKLVVGPDSAGADPGPACYGRGGPLAVTDLNFYLGKLLVEQFPFQLDRAAVERRLREVAGQVEERTGNKYSPAELCEGFLRIANQNMVQAIRAISIARGADPRDYVLVAFGGAAGQHACAVARELGMRQVLLHPDAGLLSAYGIGLADIARHRVAGVYRPYSPALVRELSDTFGALAADARREVEAEGVPAQRVVVRRALDLRYQGLDAFLTIAEPTNGSYADAYADEHRRLYGYVHEHKPLEVVAARVEVVGNTGDPLPRSRRVTPTREAQVARTTDVWFDGRPRQATVHLRSALRPGDRIIGPAIVGETTSTTVIDPGWTADVLGEGELLLEDMGKSVGATAGVPRRAVGRGSTGAPDPVLLEIFNNQFAGIAEQMGITLRNTASSVNVKERLDFSCALFTARGELVVNAPHIPVHLGAMGQTVRHILADNPAIEPGDVFVTNDPYRGGSHLPDVTVVTPVHEASRRDHAARRLLFFTASRAHHAEIGGIVPGSMPPFSTNLAQEGVLIRNFRLVHAGQSRTHELEKLLTSGDYPSRAPADNLADIAAQVAANQQGVRDLERLVERYGLPLVEAYMRHIQIAAEQKLRQALARLPDGRYAFTDHLDDGSRLCVGITLHADRAARTAATIDFTGTGPVLPGNLNANRAIVTAAVLYVLRTLIDEDIPLNEGVLAPVEIVLPECFLNPPERDRPADCAAVVGGNVETSQRVVDVLLGALGLAAASQGTMNNVLFGDSTFGYYETICGGAGAAPTNDGADAVHTHMTNTRLTDPEVLERRAPVRVREFSIRRGSGGMGRHRGGAGIVRRIEFLRELDVSILSQRRGPYPPYGLAGGMPGALGRNWLQKTDGSHEELPNQVQFLAQPGDVLVIETPGGGGYGSN
ncbi:MAG: hydantoinase B/oxoprolinase family protein [Pirellulales bacterium]|nr:hydantoinase B/oxoprolinase family protein [Pirellulales bacterium]